MKEEVHVNHSKLLSSANTINFNLLDHRDLEPDFKKEIAFDAFFKHKTSKFNLSKLSGVDKLKWLLNADTIIDFALTYPLIESVHQTNYFKPLIDAEVNGNELSVSIKDLESSLKIDFTAHNYMYYLHFNIAKKPLAMPILVQTSDLINNLIMQKYTAAEDFFFSVSFFNSLIGSVKSKEINLSFVTIHSLKGNKTIGFKANFKTKGIEEYYDISYTPPPTGKSGSEDDPGSPMNFTNNIYI